MSNVTRLETLQVDADRLERSIAALATARDAINGTLRIPAAEALLDDAEDHLDIVRAALKRALAVTESEIDVLEAA